MAFWTRRRGKVFIFHWDNKTKKQKTLLRRKDVAQFDSQPDDVVQRFVDSLEPKPDNQKPLTNDELTTLVESFCAYELSKGLNPHTVQMKRISLLQHVIPFFLAQEPPIKDPRGWTFCAVRLLEHFTQLGFSPNLIVRANTALKGFWSWLQDEGLVDPSINLRLRRPRIIAKQTPLQYALTPNDVLKFAKTAPPAMHLS